MTPTTPQEIQSIWNRGDKVLAIKLLRENSGMGLAEAKALLESSPVASAPIQPLSTTQPLPPNVLAALSAGNKVEAIEQLREARGLSLKDAKNAIDAAAASRSLSQSPGKVQGNNGQTLALLILIGALAAAAWMFLD